MLIGGYGARVRAARFSEDPRPATRGRLPERAFCPASEVVPRREPLMGRDRPARGHTGPVPIDHFAALPPGEPHQVALVAVALEPPMRPGVAQDVCPDDAEPGRLGPGADAVVDGRG